jgi:hypothetical protein
MAADAQAAKHAGYSAGATKVKCYTGLAAALSPGGALDLPEKLLQVAAAVGPDGGDEVVRVLGAILKESAPFDAGEVAVLGALGFARWTLTDDDDAVAAEDLLLHVAQRHEAVRLDHPDAMERFPRTQERLARRGLQSLLALPLSQSDAGEGAVVLARTHGWAFVAAPLHALLRLAAMGGVSLGRARLLTAVCSQLDALRQGGQGVDGERESLRRELLAARDESAAMRRAAEEERVRADQLEKRLDQSDLERRRLSDELAGTRRHRRRHGPPPAPRESSDT